jgi:hypothetical protein
MPRSPDPAIFVLTDRQTDYFTLAHARGVNIICLYVCLWAVVDLEGDPGVHWNPPLGCS